METVFTVSSTLGFLLLLLQQTSTGAQLCSTNEVVNFEENNTVGDVVTTIAIQPGVVVHFTSVTPDNPFRLEASGEEFQLIADRVLDYEAEKSYSLNLRCEDTINGGTSPNLRIIVFVTNRNDNPPVFEPNTYILNISEMSPVGLTVDRIPAIDLDNLQLVYRLTPESEYFRLRSQNIPDILVNARLDYDTLKTVQLVLTAQDSPLVEGDPSYTATATIDINIYDADNRPPWFQPCTVFSVGLDKICQSAGYTGWVILNELQAGVLPLKPGPLFAIDGDSAINEEISYSFLSGNEAGLFEINPATGNITMLKAADVLQTVVLTVLASQVTNSHQFATTTVTISIQVKSMHRPQFERPRYEGVINSVGSMAVEVANNNIPLRIIATDDDFLAVEGINPNITYTITGSSDFSLVNGYLFMMRNIPDTTLSLQVTAIDTTNDESATCELSVEVKAGVTTTALPPSTPGKTSPSTATDGHTGPSTTSAPSVSDSTNNPTTAGNSTNNPTTAGNSTNMPTTAGNGQTALIVSGEYGAGDMAALGATLGVLLFLCLLVIGLLVHRMRKGKANSKKIYEASMFRSSLHQDSPKEGIQYTNEAFQHDEDGGTSGSPGPGKGLTLAPPEPVKPSWNGPSKEAVLKSSAPLHALLPDDASDAGSDKTDNEKEVKPILTKERRVEEGYKSVWFKEDIDPNAKEEVVIIPDSRDHDSDDSDDNNDSNDSDDGDDGDDGDKKKTSKVMFADSDMDSGLGVKFEDPADDSDSDKGENIDL